MNTFDMKQWLQENKIGPYNKILITEDSDAEREDFISNEEDMAEAHMYFADLEPDDEKYKVVRDGAKIISATNEDGDEFKIGDMALPWDAKHPIKILSFKGEQGKVKAIHNTGLFASAIDIDSLSKIEEQIGVGYAMMVRPSDPLSKRF